MNDKDRQLVLVGDSSLAEIAYEYFMFDSCYTPVAFAVERDYLSRSELLGLPVVAFEDIAELYPASEHDVYVAITYQQLNRLRTRLAGAAKRQGYRLASYVSSRAFVWRNVRLGEHCFVFEDNTVQPFVEIGDNVIMWSGNHIGHHSKIGDNCFISSHVVISGHTEIGSNSFLGVNSTISNNISVGRDNWIGPNTAVMKSTTDGAFFRTSQPEAAKLTANQFFKVTD